MPGNQTNFLTALTLQTLRWYSLATMATGLWLSAVLFRRWTGSWLPGAALVACPHVILCMMTYMTEGTALLFIAAGLLLMDRALRARGGAEPGGDRLEE